MCAVVLTNNGEAWIVDKLNELDQTTPDWIAWGTGTGTASKADTNLFGPTSEARVQGTMSQPSADVLQIVGTITADGSKTITESGLFNASAGGTLITHADFTGITVASGDKIEFTWRIEIS